MFLLVLAAPVVAQFAELATTDDGSQLYFTSKMLLKGREPGPWPESRLYRFGPAGLTLYAERGALAPKDSGSSNDGVSHPSVSGDGAVVAFTWYGICRNPECSAAIDKVEVRGRETLDLGNGVSQVSRNGRWALVSALGSNTSTLVDLSSGQRTAVPLAPVFVNGGVSQVRLASDGSFLAGAVKEVSPILTRVERGIWKAGQFTPLSLPENFLPFGLTDDGASVLAIGTTAARIADFSHLAAISIASGNVTTIVDVTESGRFPMFLGVSNNGQRVLYKIVALPSVSNGPAYVWDAATGASTLVPLESGELAVDGALSGNGAVAFVATTRARIVRFDIASRTAMPLFPPPPYCDDPGPIAGGSLARLRCSVTGSAAVLTGKLTFNGTPAPILRSDSGELDIQVPWQRFLFSTVLSIDVPSDSPFQSSQDMRIYDGAPTILTADGGLFGMAAIQGDWAGILTALPSAGELFHIYMAGLGPVIMRETTGVPASLTTPNPIEWKLGCEFLPDRQPVAPIFAGLAPGMLGIYQTTFRMPAGVAQSTAFRCVLESPVMKAAFGPGLPVPFLYGSGVVVGIPPTPQPPPR
jgi:uncharacterized protein (TIGR03437 family)